MILQAPADYMAEKNPLKGIGNLVFRINEAVYLSVIIAVVSSTSIPMSSLR
jgi:hypothetical protein